MKKTINKRPRKRILNEKKYIKISSNETNDKFKELGERVQKKELKWSYYVIENLIGMHYYLKLKVEK